MESFEMLGLKLPLGTQIFSDIRASGSIYVDKTALIYKLTLSKRPVFFSRPRRFGKSTLVSVLEELFTHGVDPYDGHDSYFKGLAIEKRWHELPINDGPFNVMHLDFSDTLIGCSSLDDFKRKLSDEFMKYAHKFGAELACTDPLDAATLFKTLIEQLPYKSVVLLIDEYDAPLTAYIDDDGDENFKAAAAVLRDLFKTIKKSSDKFRFMFFTGITRYKDAAIFTAGNTVEDISQNPQYGTLCGLTRDELKQYFPEHLRYAAANVFQKADSQVSDEDVEKLLDVMAEWYDGCCFDEYCSTHVFSTWSVLNFFADFKSKFDTYWFNSGGFPAILRKTLFGKNTVSILEKIAAEDFSVSIQAFRNPITLSSMDRSVLLFQTGYLTIKAPYFGPNAAGNVRMGLPNQEMKEAMKSLICSEFVKGGDEKIVERISEPLRKAILEQDVEGLKERFNEVLLDIDHEHHFLQQESELCTYLGIFTHMALGVRVMHSLHEARGKSDMLFDLEDMTVVIEFKYVKKKDERALKKKLNEALLQIRDREYGKSLQNQPKLWRLGMVFSYEARKITHAAAVES